MLNSTFKYVPGVHRQGEARFWREGILTLDQLLENELKQLSLFSGTSNRRTAKIQRLQSLIQSRDFDGLAQALAPEDYYRIALAYPDETMFLDIESTGLSRYYDKITLIGWLLDGKYNAYIRGGDPSAFLRAMERTSVVVTYNGTLFDLPFISKEFPSVSLPAVHVDLRYLARREGLTGGQKLVEKEIGVTRSEDVAAIEGELAPVLWAQYRRGDLGALRQLLRYNYADVRGLCAIFDGTVHRILERIDAPPQIRQQARPFFVPSDNLREEVASDPVNACHIDIFPYVNSDDTFTTLSSLYQQIGRSDLSIVGIDLTGSEARPSGWCHLAGHTARTQLLGSDKDLIEATLGERPHLVSIDSPLSLPKGRVSVFDDDPGRREFGIMRKCERLLKRRGINVYPCLLPSMQRLTARGIAIASELRARGIPVIESYPGAAQDIMGIPRKRAGLDLLTAGLREFGVEGDFAEKRVSHDELDAITSAVVGVFFFAGRYESLGEEEEEALIVPNLSSVPSRLTSRKVIGLSGKLAAGKTTAAESLQDLGFAYGRYSMVLAQLLTKDGIAVSRDSLQALGLRVNREQGQRWLGRQLLRMLPSDANLVIDGLRFPDDFAFLVEQFGLAFVHFHITASLEVRIARYARRGGAAAEFSRAEVHQVESEAHRMSTMRDTIEILNHGELSELHGAVRSAVGNVQCR